MNVKALSGSLLAVSLLMTGAASARLVSVDPVKPNSNNGANFNRYVYGNNNPYKYIDPDGRAAIITYKKDGSISIDVPMKFSGPQASLENIGLIKDGAEKAFSGTYEINGKPTDVNLKIVDITKDTPSKVRNESRLLDGPTSKANGRSYVLGVGGTFGEINMASDGIPHGEANHEVGHFAGAKEHYNTATGKVDPIYSGNLMGQLPGKVDSRNIVEMLINQKNIVRYEK